MRRVPCIRFTCRPNSCSTVFDRARLMSQAAKTGIVHLHTTTGVSPQIDHRKHDFHHRIDSSFLRVPRENKPKAAPYGRCRPNDESKRLIQSTKETIARIRVQSTRKFAAPADDQRTYNLLKSWSQHTKTLEIFEAKEKSESAGIASLLIESAEAIDGLARTLLSFPSPHQVYAVEVAITAWSRLRNHPTASQRGQELFDALPFDYGSALSLQTPLVQARRRLYHALLLAWSRSASINSHAQALTLLERMKREGIENSFILVDTRSYNYTMFTMAQTASPKSMIRMVLRLWDDMEAIRIQPDAITYDAIIKAFQVSKRDLPKAVEIFLRQLDSYRTAERPHPNARPLSLTLRRILSMCQDNPWQARQILGRCISLEKERPECRGLVTLRTFLITMQAFSRRGYAGEAEELLMQLLTLDHIRPDCKAYGIVMDAYACQGTLEGLAKVHDILEAIERCLSEPGQTDLNVDCTVYNILMKAYLRTYPKKAVKLIEETINRMNHNAERFKLSQIRPDYKSYTTLMQALIKEGSSGFPQKVEEVLYLITANPAFKDKTLYAYCVAMDAWSNSNEPDAVERIQAILKALKDPDTPCYNILLNAYAKRGLSDDALGLLGHMQVKFERGGSCRPDNVSYSTVFHALHNAEIPSWQKGSVIFEDLIQQYKDGDQSCKPSEETIATVFQLIQSSTSPDSRYQEVMRVWTNLEDIQFAHGPYSITAFIEACSDIADTHNTEYQKQAFSHIVRALSCLADKACPLVYNAAFEACAKLVPAQDERDQFITDLFACCAAHGHISHLVLNTLQRICPPELYTRLTNEQPDPESKQLLFHSGRADGWRAAT